MYTAAELILALQRRLLLISPHKRRPPGEFPPGWQTWFAAMGERVGTVTGATTAAIIEVFLQRPLATPPRRTGELTQWQAFSTLWRQQWAASGPEDRRVRWFAGTVTVLWHLFFGVMLVWLMYLHFTDLQSESAARKGEEDVVQIEYIGRGTPEEIGGGPQPAPAAEAGQAAPAESTAQASQAAQAAQVASAAPAPSPAALEAPIPEVPQREVPEPQVPPARPVDQVVEVSAPTPEPADFVLQPPTPRTSEPQLTVPELTAPTRQTQVVEVPEPVQPIHRELPQAELATPQVTPRVPEVAVREVSAPVRPVQARQIATPALAHEEVRAPDLPVRVAEIPSPRPASATASSQSQASSTRNEPASASSPSSAATTSTASASSAASASQASGTAPSPASSAGSGPEPTPAPGSFPTPAKADDWGASTRNVPGGQRGSPPGIYSADGGPNIGERPVSTGQPPGTIDDRIVDLDRSGTWLKRKPNDYEPTAFDKYWRPHENLLEEWVRKGLKKVMIPIPGTNKRIECVVSILGLGGGCGISDPNLNDQPAGARPPPDIPFKPELQEDNGSVKPPAAP